MNIDNAQVMKMTADAPDMMSRGARIETRKLGLCYPCSYESPKTDVCKQSDPRIENPLAVRVERRVAARL